ncbi:flagellar hook-basal body complex protein FliE [Vibrio sp. D431a]|uniref:flagellar hook-basal body complex protein FliE n=1 Tax=Vibrio sp. D431a TaxID=2837388 RepID=UPI0025557759|nr:flagellar hook-basal body complex protein FliE [Vibrio sp. D431a]MDK9793922.1 flagellar hook-basal body complex protein FliE [Vibrio sp. D431a]
MINSVNNNQAAMLQSMERMKMQAANQKKPEAPTFESSMVNAIRKSNELQVTSSSLTERYVAGDPNVTMAQVVAASQQSGIALEMTNQIKNKMISSYNEILNITF